MRSLSSRKQRRERESKLKAVEKISHLRVNPHISSKELEQEIDHAHAREIERGLTE